MPKHFSFVDSFGLCLPYIFFFGGLSKEIKKESTNLMALISKIHFFSLSHLLSEFSFNLMCIQFVLHLLETNVKTQRQQLHGKYISYVFEGSSYRQPVAVSTGICNERTRKLTLLNPREIHLFKRTLEKQAPKSSWLIA